MRRVVLMAGLCLLTACKYDTTLVSAVKRTFQDLPDETCREVELLESTYPYDTTRQYDWPCGSVIVRVCRDNAKVKGAKAYGLMRWTLPVPDGEGGTLCVLGNRSDTFPNGVNRHWYGIAADDPVPELQDAVRKWRRETCAYAGFREGKKGRVVRCTATNVDVYFPGEGWDWSDDVE